MTTEKLKKKKQNLTSFLIILIGIFLRTYHLLFVGFSKPWKFGGLYLEFARQIFLNNYRLPEMIPHYTLGGIPFAYPPLPFYIESFLVFTLGLPEFLVVNLLPAIASIISLILFYVLIKKVLKNKWAQLFSLIFFSLFPIGYAEQLEGAGLSESFGTIFIILLILAFWSYYKNPFHIPRLCLTSFVWALTIMASPASAYLSVFIFLTFLIMLIKKEKENISKLILHIVILGFLAVLLSSVYWGTVIKNHGLDLLIDSFTSQHAGGIYTIGFLIRYGEMSIIDGEPLLSVLFIAAICILAYNKKYELLILSLLTALIPRENWVMGIIGVLIIGYAIDLVLEGKSIKLEYEKKMKPSIVIIGVTIFSLLLWRPIYFIIMRELVTEHSLDKEQIVFLENIDQINAIEENLIIVGNNEFLEWSPYLTEKTILNVWYGTEFAPEKSWIYDVHESLVNCSDTTCINELIRDNFEVGNISVIVDLLFIDQFGLENEENLGVQPSTELYDNRFFYYSLDLID